MRLKNILILLVILLALGGYFYFSNANKTPPKKEPTLFAWLIDIEEIERVEISLPREGKSQAFIKIKEKEQEEFPWFFDDSQRSKIDEKRWGGGIPLLLSGPGVVRVIAQDATTENLAEFGLTQPSMKIMLNLENEGILNIAVGDRTPDGNSFYVQVPDKNDVALVDYTWYEILERLVKEPPYASS